MSEKNKILFYISSLMGGGAERVLVTLANELVKQKKSVYIVTYNQGDPDYIISSDIKRINVFNGKEPKQTNSVTSKIKRCIWKFRRIREISKSISPDVIISFITNVNNDVIFSHIGSKIPIIVCEHTNVLRSYSRKTTLYRKLLYPFASAITVLTRHDYNIWKNKYKQVVYMPNPISVDEKYNGLSERKKVVLAAGTVSSWRIKGFDNLLRSWGLICNKYPDWKLCIAGKKDEQSMKYLKEIANENNCINVDFLGFRKDIFNLMSSSAVFCLSSRTEGLPMVLIEAMHLSCCCVAFDCITGPREIIRKDSGLLAKNQDILDLSRKLETVIKDDSLREYFAINSPNSVKNYSLERIMIRWQILLEKIYN